MADEAVAGTKLPTELKTKFENVSKLAALLATLLLVLSVVYDFSFLLALDLTFASVQTTIADHVRSAIIWAPPFFFFTALGAVWAAWSRRDSAHSTERTRKGLWLTRLKRGGPFLIFAIPSVLWSGPELVYYAAFLVLWLEYLGNAITKKPPFSMLSIWAQLAVYIAPAIIAGVGMYGYMSADIMLRTETPHWIALIKTEKGSERRFYLGLRRFEKSAVLVDIQRKVHVLDSDQLLEIDSLVPTGAFESWGCRWFGLRCLGPASSSSVAAPSAVSAASAAHAAPASAGR